MGIKCEICQHPLKNRKNRYCPRCTKTMRRKMMQSRYLQDTYVRPYFSEDLGRPGGSRAPYAGVHR